MPSITKNINHVNNMFQRLYMYAYHLSEMLDIHFVPKLLHLTCLIFINCSNVLSFNEHLSGRKVLPALLKILPTGADVA